MMRAEQDALRLKEGEAQRTLDAHQGEYSALDAELAEVEESRAEKVRYQCTASKYAHLPLQHPKPACSQIGTWPMLSRCLGPLAAACLMFGGFVKR